MAGCNRPRNAFMISDPETPSQLAQVDANGALLVSGGSEAISTFTTALQSVSTGETLLLAADSSRKYALIQNHGSTVLWIRFAAGDDSVIALQQYDALLLRSDDVRVTSAIYGIRDSGTSNVGITSA